MEEYNYVRNCYICPSQQPEFNENSQLHIQKINDEDSLIQPCYCNKIAHRNCIKKLILQQQQDKCLECSAVYQAIVCQKPFAQSFSRAKINTIMIKAILNIFGTVLVSLGTYYVLSIETYLLYDSILQLITLILAASSACLMMAYVCLLIANYYVRSVIQDIKLLCFQNEAKLHNDQPVVAQFLEKLKHSGILN